MGGATIFANMKLKSDKKSQFVEIVRVMAPGNTFALGVASMVDQHLIPAYPGIAALELVTSLQNLTKHWEKRRRHPHMPPSALRAEPCPQGPPRPRRRPRSTITPGQGERARAWS